MNTNFPNAAIYAQSYVKMDSMRIHSWELFIYFTGKKIAYLYACLIQQG